jgi:hypothetical protein
MTDWKGTMREAAERDEQEQLSTEEAQAIRRIVLAAVKPETKTVAAVPWMRRPVLVAATIVAIVSVGLGAGVHFDLITRSQQASTTELTRDPAPTVSETGSVDTPSRQLQFMTAGGTRIIWVFNQDLNLKATAR